MSDATFPESWPEDSLNHMPSRNYRRRQHDAARAQYGDGREAEAAQGAAPLDLDALIACIIRLDIHDPERTATALASEIVTMYARVLKEWEADE